MEYLYVDLGSKTLLSGSGDGYAYNLKVHPTDNIVRAGLNYKSIEVAPIPPLPKLQRTTASGVKSKNEPG